MTVDQPVEIIDVRRRKKHYALTEHERAFIVEMLRADLPATERLRDNLKVMGSLQGALRADAKIVKLKALIQIFQ